MVRLPLLRGLVPRVTAPLLPVSRLRLASPLTHSPRPSHQRLFRHFPTRSTTPPPPSPSRDPSSALGLGASLSERLRHLIKSYGWYALGVYFVLSALDFGVAFLGINLLGAEYVSHVATTIKSAVADIFHSKPTEPGLDEIEPIAKSNSPSGQEGLYAMLVLAYTIHKTLFLPVRVGLTAAFTPRLVRWLSKRGWTGGQGTKRATSEVKERLRGRNKGHIDT